MRRLSYIVALALCSVATTGQLLIAVGAWLRLSFGSPPFGRMLTAFASPIPLPLSSFVPWLVQILLTLVFATLLWRRLLLSVKAKALLLPDALTTWPGRLLTVAVVFLLVGLAALGLSVAVRTGSGVPAGVLGLPAFLLLSPVMFYVELRSLPSFRKPSNADET